jgi:hypothetical protein
MPGWIGFSTSSNDEGSFPYWFSFDESKKHITASVEPSGLQFTALMEEAEWQIWKQQLKQVSTETMGFKVGEPEEGEVGYETEWLDKEA